MSKSNLEKLAKNTQDVYERNADCFASDRSQALFEKPWLDIFANLLPEKASVLDLGCGTGQPIAAYLKTLGLNVVGMDISAKLLKIAKADEPNGDWRHGDMRDFKFDERFDGIIAWHSFFHLTQNEQREALPNIIGHLSDSGVLMLSVGHEEGEAIGRVGEDEVYHASLAYAEYESILESNRMKVVEFAPNDKATYGASILIAQKL